jgi:flagellar motor switch protein FliN/FliY
MSDEEQGFDIPESPEGGGATDEDAQAAMFASLTDDSGPVDVSDEPDLDVILDIPVTVSVEIGHTDVTIRKLLSLGQGSVIELDRLAGEPLDIKVNGTLVAHGEVVVVNDKFGIRLTDIISTAERIKKLQ